MRRQADKDRLRTQFMRDAERKRWLKAGRCRRHRLAAGVVGDLRSARIWLV
jgi:hypothetical protein